MDGTYEAHPALPSRLTIKPVSEIVSKWKKLTATPMVSICCATYNHGEYVEDAICGFLAQETDFSFEIIIRDDASEDRTTAIVFDYASRYPNIVRSVINKENEFRKGVRPIHVWPKLASGRYLAICEGDDFWISPHKLQRQVDLLERHQDAVMSVALTHYFRQDDDAVEYVKTTKPGESELIYFEELQKYYFHTSTYLIRAPLFSDIVEQCFSGHTLFGDTALRAILISHGPFAVLPDVVSVYRMTGKGIWTSLNREKRLSWEFQSSEKLATILDGGHRDAERRRLYQISRALCYLSLRSGKLLNGIKWGTRTFRYGMEEAVRRTKRGAQKRFRSS